MEEKLIQLLELEGIDEDEMFIMVEDSVVPGICTNDECDYVTNIEPDQEEGYCELCGTNTVKSLTSFLLDI